MKRLEIQYRGDGFAVVEVVISSPFVYGGEEIGIYPTLAAAKEAAWKHAEDMSVFSWATHDPALLNPHYGGYSSVKAEGYVTPNKPLRNYQRFLPED